VTRNSDAVTEPLRRNRYAVTTDVARNKLGLLEVILAQRRRRRLLDRARSSPDETAALVDPNLDLLALDNGPVGLPTTCLNRPAKRSSGPSRLDIRATVPC
jgi:hypothetical protein